MLLATSFTDRFIRKIFSAEREVVPRHSQPISIPSATQRDQHIYMSTPNVTAPLRELSNEDEANANPVRIAQ